MKKLLLRLSLVLLAVTLAGCAATGDSSSATSTRISGSVDTSIQNRY